MNFQFRNSLLQMDAMVANLVALRAELRSTHASVSEVERKLDLLLEGLGGVAAGCAAPPLVPDAVVEGGGLWEAAASWIWILLPALRSPVLALCLCVWAALVKIRGGRFWPPWRCWLLTHWGP